MSRTRKFERTTESLLAQEMLNNSLSLPKEKQTWVCCMDLLTSDSGFIGPFSAAQSEVILHEWKRRKPSLHFWICPKESDLPRKAGDAFARFRRSIEPLLESQVDILRTIKTNG
jgi:hypothetical protein